MNSSRVSSSDFPQPILTIVISNERVDADYQRVIVRRVSDRIQHFMKDKEAELKSQINFLLVAYREAQCLVMCPTC